MSNTALDPSNDRVGVFNADQNRLDETSPYYLTKSVIVAGAGITLTNNAVAGSITIEATAAGGPVISVSTI